MRSHPRDGNLLAIPLPAQESDDLGQVVGGRRDVEEAHDPRGAGPERAAEIEANLGIEPSGQLLDPMSDRRPTQPDLDQCGLPFPGGARPAPCPGTRKSTLRAHPKPPWAPGP